jgi:IPT/TIG domain
LNRNSLVASICLLVFFVSGCGGDSGSGSGGTPSNGLTLAAIAPSSVVAGSSGITLIAYGSNFQQDSEIVWNGTDLITNWISATQITASLPQSDFAAAGTATVTVTNILKNKGTSNPKNFVITSAPAATTWVRSVGVAPQSLVWDPIHLRLYASIGSSDPTSPNTVVAVDPETGNVSKPVAVGNDPFELAVSSDGSYLWVALDGDSAVQRLILPAMTKDISFALPKDPSGTQEQAVSLQAAPVNPHTVALVAGYHASRGGDGVYIYDDAIPRKVFVPGIYSGGPLIDWIQWANDDSTLYGTQYTTIDLGGIATLAVTPAGVSLDGPYGGLIGPTLTHYDRGTGLLYSFDGADDPVKKTLVGDFDLPSTGTEACTSDSAMGRYFCVMDVFGGYPHQYELWVFDLKTYVLISRVSLGNTITGRMENLVRWGNSGLALSTYSDNSPTGPGGLFLIDGAAINPNATPDVSSGASVNGFAFIHSISPEGTPVGSGDVTMTITGSNFTPDSVACWDSNQLQFNYLPTTLVSSTQLRVTIPADQLATAQSLKIDVFDSNSGVFATNALPFTVYPPSTGTTKVSFLNLAVLDMAWDAKNSLLYAGTADWDAAYPNSIVAVDPASSNIKSEQTIGSDPYQLSVSAGSEFLYVGYAGATNMTRLQIPGLTSPLTWVLNNPQIPGPYYAGDLKAAPISPHTTAVALYKAPYDLDNGAVATGGVVIYDDATPRPVISAAYGQQSIDPSVDYNVLALGASDSILASAENDNYDLMPLYVLDVTDSGAAFVAENPSFSSDGNELHSDFGTGLVYSDNGRVADPATGVLVGSYGASGLFAPDSSLNRVFVLGQTSAQYSSNSYTIQSFDQKAYTLVSSITLNNLVGRPVELIRWGKSGLAVETFDGNADSFGDPGGMLYIVDDSTFVSAGKATGSSQPQSAELVQQRWKRVSKADLAKLINRRHVKIQRSDRQ